MRKIKFRGRKRDGQWVYGGIHFSDHGTPFITIGDYPGGRTKYAFVEVEPDTVGQYTGIDDYGGIEIYEGDIVSPYYRSHGSEREYGDVNFDGGCFCYGDSHQSLDYYSDCLKVFGNIHENIELLNSQNKSETAAKLSA